MAAAAARESSRRDPSDYAAGMTANSCHCMETKTHLVADAAGAPHACVSASTRRLLTELLRATRWKILQKGLHWRAGGWPCGLRQEAAKIVTYVVDMGKEVKRERETVKE